MATFFICHTGTDEEYVRRLSRELENRGLTCWFYERDNDGESIGSAVDDAMAESPALIFVMTANMQKASRYIQNELNAFLQDRKKIIPLRVQMSKSFWPHGSRGLIQSIPVVDDCDGEIALDVINEIIRRVDGGLANYDARLKQCLDEAQIRYSIDKDGDFQTQWLFDHDGTSHTVAIELISRVQHSEQQGLVRNVSGYFLYNGDIDTLRNVLAKSKWRWRVKQLENGYLASSTFMISATARSQDIRSVCAQICSGLREVVISLLDQHPKNRKESGWWEDIVPVLTLGGLAALGAVLSDDD